MAKSKYRMLRRGEIIRQGDERAGQILIGQWFHVSSGIGQKVGEYRGRKGAEPFKVRRPTLRKIQKTRRKQSARLAAPTGSHNKTKGEICPNMKNGKCTVNW